MLRRIVARESRMNMQPGMIGLGRMGANMVQRLRQGGHDCVVFGGHVEKAAARQGGD